MSEKKNRKWLYIEIHYERADTVSIYRNDLEKIESIEDVLDALERAQDLTKNLNRILKE